MLYNKTIIKKEADTMKKICFKHDYYWTGEFVGTPTDLISGRTKDFEKLRNSEADKIKCGRKHFEAIGANFGVVTSAVEI